MRGFTIFKRLVYGYLLLLVVVISMGAYISLRLEQMNRLTRTINSVDNKIIQVAGQLSDAVLSQTGFEKKYIILKDKDFYRQFLETGKSIKEKIVLLTALIDTPEKKRQIQTVKELHARYIAAAQKEFELLEKDKEDHQAYKEHQHQKEEFVDIIAVNLEKMIGFAKADIGNKIELSAKIGRRALKLTAITTIFAIILAILLAFYNARTINRPVLRLMKGTRDIAKGKFKKHLDISSPPEIKELSNAFNRMYDRLKEVDAMKADFISHVSHELRTPLTAILEASNLLFDGVTDNLVQTRKSLIMIIQEECERLISLVNKILDLSSMDAGMMDYNFLKGSIVLLIEQSILKIKPIAQKKQISINVQLDKNLPLLNLDDEKIGQALDNLLGNALKFTPPGGKVKISAWFKKKPDQITVSISDTGCGIAKDNIKDIFDKFKKLQGKGTGLGLSIAKHIVNAHGGKIWVKSEKDQGSVFYFTIPVV